MSETNKGKSQTPLIITVNLALVALTVTIFGFFATNARQKIRTQNVDEITSSNLDSARVGSVFLSSRAQLLSNVVHYLDTQKMDLNGALSYIEQSDIDSATVYEIIGTNSKGYVSKSVNGVYTALNYANHDASIVSTFAAAKNGPLPSIAYLTEFTDEYSANNSFAMYQYAELPSGSGKFYTVLSVLKSAEFSGLIQLKSAYQNAATVLMNGDGDYVFGSSSFKSTNLFAYFYTFNGLSVSQREEIRSSFQGWDKSGSYYLYYKNASGADCIYVATAVENSDWYCVSEVPLSSFHNNGNDIGYVIGLIASLTTLMIFDVLWLRKTNAQLRQAAKEAKEAGDAKTDFLSRMSHDIRTPLNVINGSTILALKESNPPETDKYLKDIRNSGTFLLSLVNDILDLNKIGSGKLELHVEPYSLKAFGESMRSIVGNLCAEKGLEFDLSGCDEEQAYVLDPIRLKQIFFNILSNSAKFTNRGGKVSLACSVLPDEGDHVRLKFVAQDNGIGMSEEFQKKMFDPFTQENRNANVRQGTGLGLSIVKQLVDLMNGSLKVESKIDVGTRFEIEIPTTKAEQGLSAEESDAKYAEALKDKVVLVVEDNDINAQIAMALLKDKGIKTLRANDGVDAVEQVEKSALGSIDAILMDMRMPRLDGLGATKAIRDLDRPDAKTVPIIAMTANAFEDDIDHCLQAGMNAHLSKPIEPPLLYQALYEQMQKKK
jgi:signal transduction histidine kinase/ActR/RegA family two-component response regulator